MKNLNKLILSAALMMTSLCGSLLADTFSFSYIMNYNPDDPDTTGVPGEFYGTFMGTEVGDGTVTVSSVLSLFAKTYDGDSNAIITEITGPFFTSSMNSDDIDNPYWNPYGTAVVAYDRDQNNFVFTPDDFLNPGWNNDTPFTGAYLVAGSGGLVAHPLDINNVDDDLLAYDNGEGTWTLLNLTPPTNVPDSGATVALLGLALVGFAATRRASAAR